MGQVREDVRDEGVRIIRMIELSTKVEIEFLDLGGGGPSALFIYICAITYYRFDFPE